MQLQRSNDWYQARLGKATASRFGDIMAVGAAGKPLAGYKNYQAQLVIERLTGKPVDEGFTSGPMQWGIDTEPLARLRYELATGYVVEEQPFVEHGELAAGASPDGKIVGHNGGPEIKCPNTATHIQTLHTQKVPYQYYWQCVGQMWIMNWAFVDFVSFDPRLPDNAALVIIRLMRNDEDISRLKVAVTAFLKSVDDEVEFVKKYGQEAIK